MQETFILIGTNYMINISIITLGITKLMIQKINKYREKYGREPIECILKVKRIRCLKDPLFRSNNETLC